MSSPETKESKKMFQENKEKCGTL